MTKKRQHLTKKNKNIFILLKRFEGMFDSTFSAWNTSLVYLELKDDAKPLCLRPYPVLKVHIYMPKKYMKHLVSLGILENSTVSEWGALSFYQLEAKMNRVQLIRNLNNPNS